MKKSIFLSLLSLAVLIFFVSCSDKKEKNEETKEIDYSVLEDEGANKKESKAKENNAIIDLSNKGIGPIKELIFDEDIDDELAKNGSVLFLQKCTACHKTDKKFIGPSMKGLYDKRAPEWVMNMLLNPTEMIEKDPIAKQQYNDYNQVLMIDQNLTEDEARALAEYLRTL